MERGSGTEIEALQDATRGETMMIDHQGGIETYLMTEGVVEVVGVVIEATVMVVSEVDKAETERRVQLHHLRRKNLLPT